MFVSLKGKSLLIAALLFSGVAQAQYEMPELDHLRINQIQVLGSHNSYALPVDSSLLAIADQRTAGASERRLQAMSEEDRAKFLEFHPNPMNFVQALNYEHPDFETQLGLGLRNLEIDVYYDDKGGRYSHPAGYRYLDSAGIKTSVRQDTTGLAKPGFKVFHIADIDVRSQYPTLEAALTTLKQWSAQHPGHLPLFIQVEAKDRGMPLFPGATEVLPFNAAAYQELDNTVAEIIGRENIIKPSDIKGNYKTLKDAVTDYQWPLVKEARGKFIFMLLPSTAGMGNGSAYTTNNPNLEQRLMFVQSEPTDTYGAFLLLDNALIRQQDIRQRVREGYLVRTRADIETYEAKMNDLSRANAAFSSGAQIISTDFYTEENTYDNSYRVVMPGGKIARPDPVNASLKK